MDRFRPELRQWTNNVFDNKPLRGGYWKFTWEAGHGSDAWIDEEVRFNAARQLFVEKVTTRPYPGVARLHCKLNRPALREFLAGIQRAVSDQINVPWLEGLIDGTPVNSVRTAGTATSLNLAYQVSAGGRIRIELSTEAGFAPALRTQLKNWCDVN